MSRFVFRLIPFVVAFTLLVQNAETCLADVRLPGFFTNHMVMQQQKPIKVWGWADPGEAIAVELGDNSAKTKADENGKWSIELAAMNASKTPFVLTVTANNKLELNDILIGEVWLCSGQSNMEWRVRQSNNAEQEIADANYPHIRHMKVAHRPSMVPLDDIDSEWQICSPETAGDFTACGYFMARHLYKELDVPIGLVNSSWGGTRVEPWIPPIGLKQVAVVEDIYQSVMGRTPGTKQYKLQLSQFIATTEKWLTEAKSKVNSIEILTGPSPAFPATLAAFKSHQDPTMLYNGMIHGLVGFPIRGAIWYQGESNHREKLYAEKKQALINGWRELWGDDFPFYYVQIAPFQYGDEDPTILAEFWEQQSNVQRLVPNTAMVVINDIATINNIHPPDKQEVGRRLGLLAMKNPYGQSEIVATGPEVESHSFVDGVFKIKFQNTAGGLKTRDGKPPGHFELVGPKSNGFQQATATIEGDAIRLESSLVTEPTAFRFAWHKLAEPNLVGGTGLPVGAVRGGEMPSFINSIAGGDEFELVYELDLAKMGNTIAYDVDHSDKIKGFDRIGYLLELESATFGEQKVFVSMKAFTDDVKLIGVPTAASGISFQCSVDEMCVFSNVKGITEGTEIETGNIEFWPNNYAPPNSGNVQGASSKTYDFGDAPSEPRDGYGSMQIHNFGSGETLFAINRWKLGARADLGIGNSPGETRDWTFKQNANLYSSKRLRVYVRSQ